MQLQVGRGKAKHCEVNQCLAEKSYLHMRPGSDILADDATSYPGVDALVGNTCSGMVQLSTADAAPAAANSGADAAKRVRNLQKKLRQVRLQSVQNYDAFECAQSHLRRAASCNNIPSFSQPLGAACRTSYGAFCFAAMSVLQLLSSCKGFFMHSPRSLLMTWLRINMLQVQHGSLKRSGLRRRGSRR